MQGDEERKPYTEDHQGNQKVTVCNDSFRFFERSHKDPDRRVIDWRNHKDVAGPMSRFSSQAKETALVERQGRRPQATRGIPCRSGVNSMCLYPDASRSARIASDWP